MGKIFKIFILTFISFTLILTGGAIAFVNGMHEDPIEVDIEDGDYGDVTVPEEPVKEVEKTELQLLAEDSERINVLLMGLEGARTDTIMLVSFDPEDKKVDIISIPRDTYYYTEGYEKNDQRKINAVYGRSKTKGVMMAVSDVLGVPVDHYVKVSYKAVEDIVDTIGGVEVNIPFKMDYDDPYANPQLHIHFQPGKKLLNGEQSLEYLRFRKNNDGTHSDGDVGRVKRQQNFIKSAADKAMSISKLPVVAKTVYKHVKTSMDIDDVLRYATQAIGMSSKDIKMHTIPGTSVNKLGLSYYDHDKQKTEELMIDIYKNDNN